MSAGVPCPSCGCTASQVVDSRPREGTIFRRRKCKGCGRRFTTYEGMTQGPLDTLDLKGLLADDRTALRHLMKRLLGDL